MPTIIPVVGWISINIILYKITNSVIVNINMDIIIQQFHLPKYISQPGSDEINSTKLTLSISVPINPLVSQFISA